MAWAANEKGHALTIEALGERMTKSIGHVPVPVLRRLAATRSNVKGKIQRDLLAVIV